MESPADAVANGAYERDAPGFPAVSFCPTSLRVHALMVRKLPTRRKFSYRRWGLEIARQTKPGFNCAMAQRLGVVVGILVWSALAHADAFYKYRDLQTGRDVFVNRVDQIPQKYRSRAKLVMEMTAPPVTDNPESDTAPPSSEPPPSAPTVVPEKLRAAKASLRELMAGKNLLKDAPAIAAAIVDQRLAKAGTTPLDENERLQLGRMLGTTLGLALVATLLSFIVWLVMVVGAIRDRKIGWTIVMVLLWPASYLYLFIHGGKGRVVFKLACAAALASPALVGVVAASWF